jgi:hypothetical protein
MVITAIASTSADHNFVSTHKKAQKASRQAAQQHCGGYSSDHAYQHNFLEVMPIKALTLNYLEPAGFTHEARGGGLLQKPRKIINRLSKVREL